MEGEHEWNWQFNIVGKLTSNGGRSIFRCFIHLIEYAWIVSDEHGEA